MSRIHSLPIGEVMESGTVLPYHVAADVALAALGTTQLNVKPLSRPNRCAAQYTWKSASSETPAALRIPRAVPSFMVLPR